MGEKKLILVKGKELKYCILSAIFEGKG